MKKVKVRCTWEVDIEYDNDTDDDVIYFDIEENNCPSTGKVGVALENAIEGQNKMSTCWACSHQGENEILSITKEDGSVI